MPDPQFTRCPACRTAFRVTAAQLEVKGGQVRCGHCKAVFDGLANAVSLGPSRRREIDDEIETSAASESVAEPASDTIPAQAAEPTPTDGDEHPELALAQRRRRRKRWRNALLGAAIPVLALGLAGQALLHFRDAIAARWPATTGSLTRVCRIAGCVLHPLREVTALSIDASDLQADPAHKGLLILTATMRNRAGYALAYPYLELTLTDAQDQVVVRRALSPRDYASGTADIGAGLPANAELAIKLFIDASASTQAGYRLYAFYP